MARSSQSYFDGIKKIEEELRSLKEKERSRSELLYKLRTSHIYVVDAAQLRFFNEGCMQGFTQESGYGIWLSRNIPEVDVNAFKARFPLLRVGIAPAYRFGYA